jgi:hypothetical protein
LGRRLFGYSSTLRKAQAGSILTEDPRSKLSLDRNSDHPAEEASLFSNLSPTLLKPFAMPFSTISAGSMWASSARLERTMTMSGYVCSGELTSSSRTCTGKESSTNWQHFFPLAALHALTFRSGEVAGRPKANIGRPLSVWRAETGVPPR